MKTPLMSSKLNWTDIGLFGRKRSTKTHCHPESLRNVLVAAENPCNEPLCNDTSPQSPGLPAPPIHGVHAMKYKL